jgi:carboxyl-terminal processing protease
MKKIAIIALSALISLAGNAQTSNPKATSEKFNTLLYYIENMYVDSVDIESLVEHAMVSMLEELDPHSVYISSDELSAANEPLNGSFEGIGIQFNILKDTIYVVTPISGGPSEKLGIRAGDKIVQIEGETVAGVGIKNGDVGKKLKGPKGTTVNVGIQRSGEDDLIAFDIERDKIPIFSLDAAFMVNKDIGYIKISRFAKTTMQELQTALIELNSQGMEDLILDLQGNGGGLLKTAIQMADEFLSDDKLIVYTEGRTFPRNDTHARIKGKFEQGKLIVLIDEGSASASEIVSGAIQDWDRGLIIGRRSFGKGLVQRPVPLPDGSAVRLTVQKYYTPAGRCIQKSYEDGIDAYRSEKYERYANGELLSADSLEFPDSLKFFTNVKQRAVFGGGGIMPDIFVPLDTTNSSDYFSDLLRKGLTNTFALTYVDANRADLIKKYKTVDEFAPGFAVDEALMSKFLAFAEEEEVPFDEEGFNTSKFALETRIKALIARNLWDYSAFFQIVNVLTPAYMRAIEVLNDGTFEKMDLAHSQF